MKHLYAPWRNRYITEKNKRACIFCNHRDTACNDTNNFVIKRFNHCLIMLNLFPYNAGHLLIIPYRHTATLAKLTIEERHELMEATNLAMSILKKELKADGFNAGINVGGKASGGSIPGHLHMHVLPRWHGDTSFLTTLAETKQISADLILLYTQLAGAFQGKTVRLLEKIS